MNSSSKQIKSPSISPEEEVCKIVGVEYGHILSSMNSFNDEVKHIMKENEAERMRRIRSTNRHEEKVSCKCGNTDPAQFITNNREGTMVCRKCGSVIASDILFEGDWTRNFEGEEDNKQCGDAFDPLMSSAYNLRTSMITSTGKQARNKQRKQHAIEMSLDKIHQENRFTRAAYKDSEKRKARSYIDDVVSSVGLNEDVTDLAHRYFCVYRDNKEKVTNYQEHIAECILIAIRELKASYSNAQKQVTNTPSFICPKCKNKYTTKLNLMMHSCSADKETVDKKKEEVKKKPILREKKFEDELNLLSTPRLRKKH